MAALVQCKDDGIDDGSEGLDHHIAHRVDQADIDIALERYAVDDDALDAVNAADHAGRAAEVIGVDGADQRIALHVQAEPAIHAEFIEFPQSGNGNGECDGEKNAQKTVAPVFLIQKDGNIGAEQCENNAAAEMQHLVPMLDAVVELVDPAGHRRKNVKQTEHK